MHLAQSWETIIEPITDTGLDDDSQAPITSDTDSSADIAKGCFGVVGEMVGGITLLTAAFVALKKKEN